MQFKPWFNPTDGYHNYTVSWTACMIVYAHKLDFNLCLVVASNSNNGRDLDEMQVVHRRDTHPSVPQL
jgi:hypothetical protein